MPAPISGAYTIVPISELQTRSRQLVEQVKRTGRPIVVTQRGRPVAMLVNYDVYEGHLATMEETLVPGWEKRLERAQREISAGRLVSHPGRRAPPPSSTSLSVARLLWTRLAIADRDSISPPIAERVLAQVELLAESRAWVQPRMDHSRDSVSWSSDATGSPTRGWR